MFLQLLSCFVVVVIVIAMLRDETKEQLERRPLSLIDLIYRLILGNYQYKNFQFSIQFSIFPPLCISDRAETLQHDGLGTTLSPNICVGRYHVFSLLSFFSFSFTV